MRLSGFDVIQLGEDLFVLLLCLTKVRGAVLERVVVFIFRPQILNLRHLCRLLITFLKFGFLRQGILLIRVDLCFNLYGLRDLRNYIARVLAMKRLSDTFVGATVERIAILFTQFTLFRFPPLFVINERVEVADRGVEGRDGAIT